MSFHERLRRLLGDQKIAEDPGRNDEQGSEAPKPISCMEALERVQEYLDGALDGVSHAEVAHHFAVCQRCYPHLKLEERFRDLLRRTREGEVCPESVRQRVLELLATESQDQT